MVVPPIDAEGVSRTMTSTEAEILLLLHPGLLSLYLTYRIVYVNVPALFVGTATVAVELAGTTIE